MNQSNGNLLQVIEGIPPLPSQNVFYLPAGIKKIVLDCHWRVNETQWLRILAPNSMWYQRSMLESTCKQGKACLCQNYVIPCYLRVSLYGWHTYHFFWIFLLFQLQLVHAAVKDVHCIGGGGGGRPSYVSWDEGVERRSRLLSWYQVCGSGSDLLNCKHYFRFHFRYFIFTFWALWG